MGYIWIASSKWEWHVHYWFQCVTYFASIGQLQIIVKNFGSFPGDFVGRQRQTHQVSRRTVIIYKNGVSVPPEVTWTQDKLQTLKSVIVSSNIFHILAFFEHVEMFQIRRKLYGYSTLNRVSGVWLQLIVDFNWRDIQSDSRFLFTWLMTSFTNMSVSILMSR